MKSHLVLSLSTARMAPTMEGRQAGIKHGDGERRMLACLGLGFPRIESRSNRVEPIRRLTLADEQATVRLGQLLADIGHYGDILALWGGLGCGKTVFARAFIRTLTDPKTEVPSPTFTLVQSYGPVARLGCFIHHFDLFRLAHPDEAYELAIEDAFSDGIALIEWPDRLGSLLPSTRLDIHFIPERAGMGRCALLCGGADWRHRLYEANLG